MGWEAGERNLVFCLDDGRIAGRYHEWVQDALTVTVSTFRRIGLYTNLDKTKAMMCTPGFIWGEWEEWDYKRQALVEGSTFRERKKTRVICSMCGVTVTAPYLKYHMARSCGICVPQTRGVDEVVGGPTTYVVSLPKVIQEVRCPVPGCLAVAHSAGRLSEHFMFCPFRSNVLVVQEGKEPLPRCDLCIMHMPEGAAHQAQEDCTLQEEHPYEVEAAGCGNCGQVFGGNV